MTFVLALDQGTSSSRGIIYDSEGRIRGMGQYPLVSSFPHDGWVEQDPEDIWQTTIQAARDAIVAANIKPRELNAIGITNQRETTLIWDAATGESLASAIVWQDRRTTDICDEVVDDGFDDRIKSKTGLVVDPYFSSTKLAWLLRQPSIRGIANSGNLRFGTVDSFLIWRLTRGKSHFTDATNASRTQLFDIDSNNWSEELLEYFNIPQTVLPEVNDNVAEFGIADIKWLGARIPILGVCGDQQSALIGQACFDTGMTKSTYGTGCFLITNTGAERINSNSGLLTTVGYRTEGRTTYALEGSIFNAGTSIKWLRDKLNLIEDASETEAAARRINGNTQGVVVVPAFTGLGAPHWKPDARGLICGLTLDTGIDEIVTATLKSIAHQTVDLINSMASDGVPLKAIRVDGGMVQNDWFCQYLANVSALRVDRPESTETTAFGAAMLALVGCGELSGLESVDSLWQHDHAFLSSMPVEERRSAEYEWQNALARV